jgi:PST family polysaccharide transporter
MNEAIFDNDLSDRDLGRQSARGVVLSLGAQGLRFLMQFLSQVLLARLLVPSDFGLLAMAMPVLLLAQTIGELGLAHAVIQRPNLTRAEMSLLFWLSILINTGLAVVMLVTAPLIAWLYHEPLLIDVVAALAVMLVLNGIGSQHMAVMARRMKFASMAIVDVACLFTAIAIGIGGALAGWGYWALVAMQVSNIAIIAVLSSLLSGWQPTRPALQGGARGVGAMLSFGAHLTGYNLVTYASGNLDSVLIGAFAGRASLGFYDRSMKLIVTPLWQLSMPLVRVATSLLSRLQTNEVDYRRAFLGMLKGLMLVTTPAFAAGALTAEQLVPAVLGPQWTEAAALVSWLCLSAILVPVSISASWLFVSQGRVRSQLRWAGLRTAVSLGALLIGLCWGVLGVAIAYAVLSPVAQGVMVWGATREGPVNLRNVVVGILPVLMATAIGSVLAYAAALWLPPQAAFMSLAITLAIIAGGGMLSLLCFPEGLALIRDVVTVVRLFRRPKQPQALPDADRLGRREAL